MFQSMWCISMEKQCEKTWVVRGSLGGIGNVFVVLFQPLRYDLYLSSPHLLKPNWIFMGCKPKVYVVGPCRKQPKKENQT